GVGGATGPNRGGSVAGLKGRVSNEAELWSIKKIKGGKSVGHCNGKYLHSQSPPSPLQESRARAGTVGDDATKGSVVFVDAPGRVGGSGSGSGSGSGNRGLLLGGRSLKLGPNFRALLLGARPRAATVGSGSSASSYRASKSEGGVSESRGGGEK
ncbi:unnamed protein product, partial [Choristocarpus tenellus]